MRPLRLIVLYLSAYSEYVKLECGAPQLCLLVYKPHEYYSYLRTTNHSEIWVMFTNYRKRGPHIADGL